MKSILAGLEAMISVPTEKGETMPNCQNCQEMCPQAELAHEAAKGRMYATNEFIAILKKVESGRLVEVVRCRDCEIHGHCATEDVFSFAGISNPFCCAGKIKDGFGG